MLIVVRERTKEIGIQRALGATPMDIIKQILNESVVLTLFSGYVGLIFSVGVIELLNIILINSDSENEMFKNPEINFNIAIASIFILVIFGALAGLLPANRAVSIKPIEALRDE
jgi:putative ABC transport system permease protein